MIKRAVEQHGLVGDLFHDGSGERRKAIMLIGGSEGGKTWSGSTIRRALDYLVGQGYTLLSLAYFKSPGLPRYLETIPLEYFERAFGWLASQPEVAPDELALIGGSKGAEASLVLASMNPRIKAVVALGPSCVVWQGIPKMGVDVRAAAKSSWTHNGTELPFVPYEFLSWNLGTLLFGRLRKEHEKALENRQRVEAARIPVENIRGSILLISGRRDQMWPSTEMSQQILTRLAEKGFAHHSEHIAYDTGHNGYLIKRECWQAIGNFLKHHFN